MSELRRDIVFVHIPKTAGTSIRISLEKALRQHVLLRDYGLEPETTPELGNLIYKRKVIQNFRQRFGSSRGIFLSGHFPSVEAGSKLARGAARYWDYFNAESFMTFLRHPVQRVYSEFVHIVNHQGWRGSFEEFLKTPNRCRSLSMSLAGVDVDSFGFVGFMEEFDASLSALGKFVGVELPTMKLNSGNYDSIEKRQPRNEDQARMISQYSQDDIELYEKLRTSRGGIYLRSPVENGSAQSYRGFVRMGGDHAATGWLCNTSAECIAEVEVFRNGRPFATARADRYREHVRQEGLSRSGMCGFRIDFSGPVAKRANAEFTFRARNSQYELQGSPLRV